MQRKGGVGPPRFRATSVALLVATLAVPGCAESRGDDEAAVDAPVLVMAASSLNRVLPALIERFEGRTGKTVDLALGATGSLATQIENGAPADLFFAADEATIERLVESGSIRPSSVRTYATGQLVLVWRDQAKRPASPEALADAGYDVVAIANPEIAPYGAAARETLQHLGVWNALKPRIVQGESIAQTYQLVRTGNADIALVARSVVDTTASEFIPVDPRLHAPIPHAVGVLERSRNPVATRFLEFVLSDEGQAIFAANGFGPADS